MHTMMSRALALTLVIAALGCSEETVGIGNDTPVPIEPDSVRCPFTGAQGTLQVLGCGKTAAGGPYTAEVAAFGTRAYTTTYSAARQGPTAGNIINVWDVSGNTPTLVDTLAVASGNVARTSDISISPDGTLMAVGTEPLGSLVLYRLNGTAKPELVTAWPVPGGTNVGIHTAKLARVNGTLYAFAQLTSGQTATVIVDLSNPAAPREVARVRARQYVHDVYVRDGMLFLADWDAGIGIYDIGGANRGGSITNPVLINGALTVGGNSHNVWWFHDPTAPEATRKRYLFVGEEQSNFRLGVYATGDLHVVDISDLMNPREVAAYHVAKGGDQPAGAHNFWMDEERGILYAAFYNGGVRALDVRGDLSACTVEQRFPDGRCDLQKMGREKGVALDTGGAYIWGVQYTGNAVYASDMLNGIWKLAPVVR